MSTKTISATEVARCIAAGAVIDLIDVRTPIEYAQVHAPTARLMPLDRLDPAQIQAQRAGRADQPLYLLCKAGKRATQAAERLAAAGVTGAVVVEGGTDAWIAAGLPVVRRKVISLERQVRIAAGLLVLTGVALGFLVHPAFFGLAAFMGAGLTFAGITDFCGMALLLARMPWNNVATGAPTQGDKAAAATTTSCCCGSAEGGASCR